MSRAPVVRSRRDRAEIARRSRGDRAEIAPRSRRVLPRDRPSRRGGAAPRILLLCCAAPAVHVAPHGRRHNNSRASTWRQVLFPSAMRAADFKRWFDDPENFASVCALFMTTHTCRFISSRLIVMSAYFINESVYLSVLSALVSDSNERAD